MIRTHHRHLRALQHHWHQPLPRLLKDAFLPSPPQARFQHSVSGDSTTPVAFLPTPAVSPSASITSVCPAPDAHWPPLTLLSPLPCTLSVLSVPLPSSSLLHYAPPPTAPLAMRLRPDFAYRPYGTWAEQCVSADLSLIDPLGKLLHVRRELRVTTEVKEEVEDTWWIDGK